MNITIPRFFNNNKLLHNLKFSYMVKKMRNIIKKTSKTKGLPPGSLVYIGDKKQEKPDISILDYNSKDFKEIKYKKVEDCFSFKNKRSVTWVNIDGINDTDIISKIGKNFDIHSLVLEDILNTDQRPKLEDYDNYIFIVLKMLHLDENNNITIEQISFILTRNMVISFQEMKGDVFDSIRERIRNNKGRIRKMGADYLLYSLIDSIVDNYFLILEKISEKIETIEEELIENPIPETLQEIYRLKREMIFLRKSIWPLREVISGLMREESRLIRKTTNIFLRDLYDHTIQVIDTVESFRDMISGMLDIYMSSVSNKMNEVMKVLTIFAAIFIPLTFIAGVYGMNFTVMPELTWVWGYPMALFIMISVACIMLVYFKRKKWL